MTDLATVQDERHRPMRLSEAARLLPGRPDVRKLHRWIHTGLVGPDGQRIHLAASRIGGMWYVTWADLEVFFDALTPRALLNPRRRDHRRRRRGFSPSRHRRAIEALRAQGFDI